MKKTFLKIWPVGIIVFIWLVFSFPYFFKGLVPFPSDYLVTFFPPWSSEYAMPVKNNAMPDVITQIYPWKKLTIDMWRSWQIPLWNPYSFSGTAHAGNYQTAVFSPFNILFFVLPYIDAWSLLILLQPLLAGVFMYIFVKSLDRSKEASLLASVAFMFCGFMVVWMAYGTLGYAGLFLPFIFWGIHTKKGWPVSLGIALSLFSGHFQVSVYVIGAALVYIFWTKQWKMLWFMLSGLLIASPQILLGFRSFAFSTRGSAVVKGEVIPWVYLVTLVAPDFFGNPVTRNDWFGHYAEWAGFAGVIPLVLAFFSLTKKIVRESWFFIILAVISLLLALPTPVNDLLYILKIPVLSGSAASRIILLTSFSIAVLAAYGLDALGKDKKYHWMFSAVCLCIVAILWAVLLIGKPLPADKLAVATRNFIMPSALVLAAVILFFIKKKIVLFLLIGLAAFDLLRFAVKWMPFEERQYIFPQVKSLQYLSTYIGYDRVFGGIGAEVGNIMKFPLVEGYDAVYQARYGEFINAVSKGYVYPAGRSVVLFDKAGMYKTEALQLLGIKYIYHRVSDGNNVWAFPYWEYSGMRSVYSDEKYEIFEYPDAYPRAYLTSSYVIGDIATLFSKDLNRRDTLVLEEKPLIEPEKGTGSANIRVYTPTKVIIETDSSSSKLLFLSDTYDTGWEAAVDGKISKIYRADYDFRAVPVPAGSHTVEFRYHPKEFRWGIILSITGFILAAYLLKRK